MSKLKPVLNISIHVVMGLYLKHFLSFTIIYKLIVQRLLPLEYTYLNSKGVSCETCQDSTSDAFLENNSKYLLTLQLYPPYSHDLASHDKRRSFFTFPPCLCIAPAIYQGQ